MSRYYREGFLELDLGSIVAIDTFVATNSSDSMLCLTFGAGGTMNVQAMAHQQLRGLWRAWLEESPIHAASFMEVLQELVDGANPGSG